MSVTPEETAIRPFTVEIPEAELEALRARIVASRCPAKETAADQSQGTQLAPVQELARSRASEHGWRKVEAKLNALPQFITEIDGLDVHLIHVRSKHENALPLVVTHGWPGSIIEPLANPTAYGAEASGAFHLVISSMPGYGFSGKPTTTGRRSDRIARAWAELMKRLGYTKYVAQVDDWRAIITDLKGAQAPAGPIGIHDNVEGEEFVPERRGRVLRTGRLPVATAWWAVAGWLLSVTTTTAGGAVAGWLLRWITHGSS
jgi:hypothetical protein